MGKTTHFGLNSFGAEGRISDEGYKFSLKDRELMDAILFTLSNHDHRQVGTVGGLAAPDPTSYPTLATSPSGGLLPAGITYYYKFSYLDVNGNETAASVASTVSTPSAIPAPVVQTLATATTGGTLIAGTYKYALSFYQTAGGETTAASISTVVVPAGTSTNTITIPLETLPDGADSWKIYRKAPGDLEYWYLDNPVSGTTYVDDGSVSPDCTKRRPINNSTNSINTITISIPAAELPLDTRVTSWRIYRTDRAGSYPSNSLVATVVETTTEGGADLVTSFVDIGNSLFVGAPLSQSAVPPDVPQLDASDVFDPASGRLPSALAPLGVRAFNMLLPGTLAAQDYNQVFLPHDMLVERIDGFYLTAPTGLTPSTDYLTVRLSDDSNVDEVMSLYNDALPQNEIQRISNDATSGTFTLSFDGQGPTAALAYNSTSGQIETALELFSNIVDVTVTGLGTPANPWIVEFLDPGDSDVAIITANDTGLTGGTTTITVSIPGSNGGTFTLSDGTDTTSAIAYNAAAATIETRLQTDITSITDVNVTGTGVVGDPWVIVYVNPAGVAVDLLIVNDTSLSGNSTITEVVAGRGIQIVDLVIDANQAYHSWQSSTTDFGEMEAELVPGGTQVSDNLALNDVASELDAQFETNGWYVGALDPGDYAFSFYVSDYDKGSVYDLTVNDIVKEVASVDRGTSTGGTFTLTVDTVPTAAIAWNATAEDVKTALELISTVDLVTVTGTGTVGDPWICTFDSPIANLAVSGAGSLTGGDATLTVTEDVAGSVTALATLTVTDEISTYSPAYQLEVTLDGTENIQMKVEKTDADTNRVRVDKYKYEVVLPRLYGGQTVTVEVLVTGTPTTNGDNLQLTVWY